MVWVVIMPEYTSNMSLVAPQDANLMQNQGLYNQYPQGMNPEMMQAGQMFMGQNQTQQPMTFEQKMQAMQDQQNRQNAYKMMAQGIQGMGRNMQMQMPSGNTAQIMRDQNQYRFAGTPQQQMANALRRR